MKQLETVEKNSKTLSNNKGKYKKHLRSEKKNHNQEFESIFFTSIDIVLAKAKCIMYFHTSKMTTPRATHLTMFQFSFRNV